MANVTMLGTDYYPIGARLGASYYPQMLGADDEKSGSGSDKKSGSDKGSDGVSRWEKARTIITAGSEMINNFFNLQKEKASTEGEKAKAEAARQAALDGDTSAVAEYLKKLDEKYGKAFDVTAATPWILGGAAAVGIIMMMSMTSSRRRRRR